MGGLATLLAAITLAGGDRYENGKLIDCDGKEVPIESANMASEH